MNSLDTFTPARLAATLPKRAQTYGASATASAVLTIASRDVRRFLRDRARLIGTLIFPLIFVGILGGSLQSNLGQASGFNLLTFTFLGVFAQTLFQSTVTGLTSLIEDRENDFSQEMFIAPISRYAIIFGKILGESVVALLQVVVLVLFGILAFHVPFDAPRLLALVPVALIVCLLGGSFGVMTLSLFNSQRAANQVIPFLVFPQFFLAGIFTPIKTLPLPLDLLAKITPLRYAVDLTHGIFYAGQPEYDKVVLLSPFVNLLVILAMTVVFTVVGTTLFVRGERNR